MSYANLAHLQKGLYVKSCSENTHTSAGKNIGKLHHQFL